MELEEMKLLWSDMSRQLEDQKKLTDQLIMDMTKEKLKYRLGKISMFEGLGAIICFAMAFLLLVNFGKLDTWYLLLCGIFTLITLVALPVFSLITLRAMKSIRVGEGSMKETLMKFRRSRTRFLLVQRLGVYLAFGLVFTSLPVAGKLFNNKDIFLTQTTTLYWYVPAMLLFLLIFARWGYSSYSRITKSAENLLKELEE